MESVYECEWEREKKRKKERGREGLKRERYNIDR